MLEIKNLTVKFASLVAVNKFNIEVKKKTIHSLIGPNGAGKTTVFNAIFNLVPYTGEIFFLNKNLKPISPHERVSMGLTRTFQNLNLFYSMTVEENLKMGLHSSLKSNVIKDFAGLNVYETDEVNKKVKEVSEILGIKNLLKAYPIFLPYGVQKIIELGRSHSIRLYYL